MEHIYFSLECRICVSGFINVSKIISKIIYIPILSLCFDIASSNLVQNGERSSLSFDIFTSRASLFRIEFTAVLLGFTDNPFCPLDRYFAKTFATNSRLCQLQNFVQIPCRLKEKK